MSKISLLLLARQVAHPGQLRAVNALLALEVLAPFAPIEQKCYTANNAEDAKNGSRPVVFCVRPGSHDYFTGTIE
jgi:hypothetical protein